jgi:hypothetical protein
MSRFKAVIVSANIVPQMPLHHPLLLPVLARDREELPAGRRIRV